MSRKQFQVLVLELRTLGDRDLIRLANGFEQRLAAERLLAVARRAGTCGDATSRRKRARAVADTSGGSTGRSGAAAGREARRAAAVAANPAMARKVADGSITGDGIDAALKAADQETGAIPDEVIDAVSDTPPDQARRMVEDLLAAQTTAEEANETYAAQMQARRVRRYTRPADGAEQGGRAAAIAVGVGPIGDDLVAEYLRQADLSVLFQGLSGQPLWLGRVKRHATAHQFLTLVIRDRGCVLCGAGYQRCEAHHLTPWNAPKKGRTDLDNLALLCGACHRRLHQTNQTLVRARGPGSRTVWATRPATTDEHVPIHTDQRATTSSSGWRARRRE